MSYNKELETNADAKREQDETMKKNAADRLKRNADWNKKNRSSKK